MKMKLKQRPAIKSAFTILFLSVCFLGNAQLKGGHILGAMGLQSGTQAPANALSVYIPAYLYDAGSLRDANGNESANPDLTMFLTGIGANYVSSFKILGANYGATLLVAFASNTIQEIPLIQKTHLHLQTCIFSQFNWAGMKKEPILCLVINYIFPPENLPQELQTMQD